MSQPKAFLFDLLTALSDSWTLWNTAAGSVGLGHAWRKQYLEVTYGCDSYRPYPDLVLESANRTPGLADPETAASRLLKSWSSLKPWPETASVLRQLRSKGFKLGVVTNCSEILGRQAADICAKACGEGFGFDAVVTAEEVGFYKPNPKTYEAGLEALGLKAEDVVFVAGSNRDVPGAAAVGMRVCWHNRIGLPRLDVNPLREGKTLEEALQGFL